MKINGVTLDDEIKRAYAKIDIEKEGVNLGYATITKMGESHYRTRCFDHKPGKSPWKTVSEGTAINGWIFEPDIEIKEAPCLGMYNNKTGEFKPREEKDSKAEVCRASLYATFQRIRDIINSNITWENSICITLTYARENVILDENGKHSVKSVRKAFDKFWNGHEGKIGLKKYIEIEYNFTPYYIAVMEPQRGGYWHFHTIVFNSKGKMPFIENEIIWKRFWKKGFTKTKSFKEDITNCGAYFAAYLTDIDCEELQEEDIERYISEGYDIEKKLVSDGNKLFEKRIIKGARMCYYPPGVNILSHSKGIKMPQTAATVQGIAEVLTDNLLKTKEYESTIKVAATDEIVNRIKTAYWYKKRV